MFVDHPMKETLFSLAVALCRLRREVRSKLTKEEIEGYDYFISRSIYAMAVHHNSLRGVRAPDFEAFCEYVALDSSSEAYLHVESVPLADNSVYIGASPEEEIGVNRW